MNGPEHLEILEPLGADQGTFAARDTATGSPVLVVVERVTRASPVPAARTELLRRGRALKALEHPKVVRVRDVFERDGEVLVVSDYVDGEWLSSLMMMQPRPPLGVMLRVVIDVLEGLGALHGLHDERDKPLGFVHGALGPDTVLVAADGVAEIARSCRLPRPGANERYVAPELRRGDGPADVGSDIYAAGAILRDIVVDAPSDATWAEPLTDIAWRACAVDPETRWPSALAMATTVRRIAGSRLATAAAVAEFMRRRFGDKMLGRRAALEALDEPGAPSSAEPVSLKASDLELLDPSSAPTLVASLPALVPTLQPPPVQPVALSAPVAKEVPLARVALVKKPALILETQEANEPPQLPEAATKRRPTTSPAPAVSVAPAPPPAPPQKSLPPPTIMPEAPAAAPMLEAYRRQMPTFPTFEEAVPPRRRVALQAVYIAAAIAGTFVLGWWVGRTYAPPGETVQTVCPSAATLVATRPTPPPTAIPTRHRRSRAAGRVELGPRCERLCAVVRRARPHPPPHDDRIASADADAPSDGDRAGRRVHRRRAEAGPDGGAEAQRHARRLRSRRALTHGLATPSHVTSAWFSQVRCRRAKTRVARTMAASRSSPGQRARERGAHLRVADAPHRARLPVSAGEETLDLLDPPRRQPGLHARPHPVGQRRAVARDGQERRPMPDVRERVLALPGAEGSSGELEDLERAADAHEIVRVQASCAVRVDCSQAIVQRRATVRLGERAVPRAHFRAARRCLRQPEEQRLHPEERSSAEDGHLPPGSDVLDRAGRALGPRRRVDVLHRIQRRDQVMRRPAQLHRRRLARADVEAAIDLHAVGAHHLAVEALRELHRERRLPARRRSDDGEELPRVRARGSAPAGRRRRPQRPTRRSSSS